MLTSKEGRAVERGGRKLLSSSTLTLIPSNLRKPSERFDYYQQHFLEEWLDPYVT
ncbi:hypothetical protein [Paenibacillus foliorum]|uniref:hypothetical protein n=1 Tax=Paenibacillus foliorum TaxID=2654974 RepID=UPI0014909915|nr:hypothetical protein [Paenibacillus foliorum]